MWIYHTFFNHSSFDGNLACFNSSLLWLLMLQVFTYKFLCEHVFSVILGVYVGGISGPYGNSVFNIWRNCWTVFQSDTSFYISPSNVWDNHTLFNSTYIFSSCIEVWLTDKNCIYLRFTTWWFDICIYCEMLTIIKLINSSITSHSYFLWWECLRSLLANFQYTIPYY